MNFLSALLAFALAIGILVVVHEYGHYSVARWCGVKVLNELVSVTCLPADVVAVAVTA